MKLKTKIQLFILILIIIVTTIEFLFFVERERERSIEIRKKICLTLIHKLKNDVSYAVIINNKKFLKNILSSYANINFIENIIVFVDGTYYFSLKKNITCKLVFRVENKYKIKSILKKEHQVTIRICYNINDLKKDFKIHMVILIILLIFLFLLSYIIVEYYTSKFLSPADEFLTTIKETEKGNYKLMDTNTSPEFLPVFNAYNSLIITLKKREEEIRKKVKELEQMNINLKDKIIETEMLYDKIIAQEKLASLGTITAGIAHEINNPVAAIKGLSELSLLIKDSKKYEQAFEKIIKHCNRIQAIVKSVKDFSSELHFNELLVVNLKDLILETIELCKSGKILPDSIDITGNYTKKKIYLRCHKIQIMEVFQNLISNSVDAIEKKGSINIDINEDNSLIIIFFSDNGHGIPEDIQSKIFDPFFTTKGTTGTGLGLFVVHKIIKNHKGWIEIVKRDKGTCFKITLPKNL